jgi:hypothetical protein
MQLWSTGDKKLNACPHSSAYLWQVSALKSGFIDVHMSEASFMPIQELPTAGTVAAVRSSCTCVPAARMPHAAVHTERRQLAPASWLNSSLLSSCPPPKLRQQGMQEFASYDTRCIMHNQADAPGPSQVRGQR